MGGCLVDVGIAFLGLDISIGCASGPFQNLIFSTGGHLDVQFYRSPWNLISARVINVTFSGKKIAKFPGRRRLENI